MIQQAQADESACAPATDGRLPLPRETTPTWEIELLLSGAVVFALFQVPDAVHTWGDALQARAGRSADMVVRMGTIYALMVNYALIAMFLTHLTARAYWIALVGIHSVYPGGVRWENYRQGPIARSVMRQLIPSTPHLIERADNFASLCFAFGLLVVMSAFLGAVFALPSAVLAAIVSEAFFDGKHLDPILFSIMAVILLPMMLAGMIDKAMGKRLAPGELPPEGLLTRTIAALCRLPINTLPAPLMLMVTTNQRGRRGYVLFFLALFAMMLLLIADLALRKAGLPIEGYDYLPDRAAIDADPKYYREFRDEAVPPEHTPSIDAQIATGDWLRLVVPFNPERHGALVERRCTEGRAGARTLAEQLEAKPGTEERQAAEAEVLRCLQRELALQLDGEPIAPELVFSRDPDTDLRGVLAVIPIAGLAPGRHVLSLRQPPKTKVWDDAEALARHEEAGPLRIPFWR